MMSFCKKSVNSFLCLTNSMNTLDSSINSNDHKANSTKANIFRDELGLMSLTSKAQKTPNVLESSTIKSSPPLPSPILPRKDLGAIGFIDDIGGGVDGLMSCTESLGFESSDERRIDDEIELDSRLSSKSSPHNKWKKSNLTERLKVKKFPPPISSLDKNGQPYFFLRPVRKDGRLELAEVRIHKPEILRASREDGRLRLHLVKEEEVQKEDQDNEEKEQEENERANGDEWRITPGNGSDQGFRRCHKQTEFHHHNRSNHHHNLQVWSQHCVTTR